MNEATDEQVIQQNRKDLNILWSKFKNFPLDSNGNLKPKRKPNISSLLRELNIPFNIAGADILAGSGELDILKLCRSHQKCFT